MVSDFWGRIVSLGLLVRQEYCAICQGGGRAQVMAAATRRCLILTDGTALCMECLGRLKS